MFINHRLLKIAGRCFVTAGLLLACLTAAEARTSRGQSGASYLARGSELHSRGELERAIADFDRAIDLNKKYVKAYNNRANARYAKGDYEGALADYNLALEINPSYAQVYANCGMAWLRRGRRVEAEADFAEALALKPEMKPSLDQRISQVQSQLVNN